MYVPRVTLRRWGVISMGKVDLDRCINRQMEARTRNLFRQAF